MERYCIIRNWSGRSWYMNKARATACANALDVEGIKLEARNLVFHRVVETTHGAHDGQRSVPLAVELIQAAGFVARWHHEEVRPGLDEVGERLVQSDVGAELR